MNPAHSSFFQKSKESFPGGGGRQHGLFFHPPRAEQLERESSEAVGMCDTLKASTGCHVMGKQCIKLGNRNLTWVIVCPVLTSLGLVLVKKRQFLLVCLVMCLHSTDWCHVAGRACPCWDTAVLPG